MATAENTSKGPARLTFHRYGNQAFVAQVWDSSQEGTVLPVSAREKEIRKSARVSEMAVIPVVCDAGARGLSLVPLHENRLITSP